MSSERENILEVLETEQRWTQAHLDLDLSVIESLLSDDYQHFGPDGTVTGKADLLASYGSGERFWEIAESSGHDVKILGKVVVVTGTRRGLE